MTPRPSRPRAAFLAAVGLLAVASIAHGVLLGWDYLAGIAWGEPLLQEPDQHLVWSPYIHPPLYAEFLIVVWRVADVMDTDPRYYVYLYSAVVVGVVVVVGALWTRSTHGPAAGLLAALLLAVSPTALRPYEEYPLMKGVMLAVALITVAYVRRGGARWAAGAVVAGLFAAELHLSAWFVIGPLFAGIFFTLRDRRRGIAVASVAVIGLFLATTWPGLYEVLEAGPDRPPDWVTPPWQETISIEWTNPWLYAALPLWLAPAVRRADPGGALLALAAVGYTGITLGLQIAGLAIGGGAGVDAHHYFELIDAILILGAAAGLGAARSVLEGAPRRAVEVAAAALVVTQIHLWLVGREALYLAAG